MKKIICTLLTLLLLINTIFFTEYSVFANEIKLKKELERVCQNTIVDFVYDDFDSNGTYEAFATTTKDLSSADYGAITVDIWFITDNSVKQLYSNLLASVIDYDKPGVMKLLQNNGNKFIVVSEWYQTGDIAYIWYVKSGNAVFDSNASKKGICFIKNNEEYGWIEGCHSTYDGSTYGTGHTWKTYYFYFYDGLKEYGGIRISENDIKNIDNGTEIINNVKKLGTIQSIFARENGIININYLDYDSNRNLTLLYYNNRLQILEFNDWMDGNQIEKSDQGGKYATAMIPSIATFPDKITQYVNSGDLDRIKQPDFDTYFSSTIVKNYDYIYNIEMPAGPLMDDAWDINKYANGFVQSMKHVFDGKSTDEAQQEFYDAIVYDLIANTYSLPNYETFVEETSKNVMENIKGYLIGKGFSLIAPTDSNTGDMLFEYIQDIIGETSTNYELSYNIFEAVIKGSKDANDCVEKVSRYMTLKQETEKLKDALTLIKSNTDKQQLKNAVSQVLDSLYVSPVEMAKSISGEKALTYFASYGEKVTAKLFEDVIVDGFKDLFCNYFGVSFGIPVSEIKLITQLTNALCDVFFATTVTSDQEIRLYYYRNVENACRLGLTQAKNNYVLSKDDATAHALVNCYDMYLRIYEHEIRECLNFADIYYHAGLFATVRNFFDKGKGYDSAVIWINTFKYDLSKLKELKDDAYNQWGIETGNKKLVYLISYVNGQYAMCEEYYVSAGSGFYCNLSKFDKMMETLLKTTFRDKTCTFEGFYRDKELKQRFNGYLEKVNENSVVFVNYKLSTTIKVKKLNKSNFVYTGTSQAVDLRIVDVNGKTLTKGKDYTVKYPNENKVGTYIVKVTYMGDYYGSDNFKYTILPKGTAIKKLTSPKSKKIKVAWKKQATQTNGYEIQYSTSSKFTKKTTKTVTVKKNKTTSTTIKKLKGKKKYYVRIRTYKTVGKTKYYSSWSKAKTVKTKK